MCQLQQELSEARTIGHTVTDENNQKEVNENLQAELDAQRRDLEVEHHRKMTSQREEMVRNEKKNPFFFIDYNLYIIGKGHAYAVAQASRCPF